MSEQNCFENFLSKFIVYATQAGITDDATKRNDLLDKITKPLPEGIRPHLDLVPTFGDLREKLGLIFWDIEAEKKSAPHKRTTHTAAIKPSSTTYFPFTRTTANTTREEKKKSKYSDKRRAELSVKEVVSTVNKLDIWRKIVV